MTSPLFVIHVPVCNACRATRFGTECPQCGLPLEVGEFAALDGFSTEQREGDDGAATMTPGKPTQIRPSSRWRRYVGPWERVR